MAVTPAPFLPFGDAKRVTVTLLSTKVVAKMGVRSQEMTDGSPDVSDVRGDAALDAEHRMQVQLLAALRDAAAAGRPAAEQVAIFDRLVEFSKLHFSSEEMLMRLYNYPEFGAHQLFHDEVLARLGALKEACVSGPASSLAHGTQELEAAVVDHIRSADRALAEYLAGLAAPEK